jgi:hypothetical protein
MNKLLSNKSAKILSLACTVYHTLKIISRNHVIAFILSSE